MSNKFHVVELNEFNIELLERVAVTLNLQHIKRILSFSSGVTLADQSKEHQGLDPWVQWVSIHSETRSQQHGIIRLGDVAKLQHEQIWERLAKKGVTTGVWGIMNGSRGNATTNAFFFADPWTFSEAPFPSKLANFLSLPVYYAKNYLSLSKGKLLASAFQTSKFILKNIPLRTLIVDARFLLKHAAGTKLGSCFLFAAFELISTRLFDQYRRRHQPEATFIFLNSIAHFQHHEWKNNVIDRKTELVFRSIDRMLSIILPPVDSPDKILVVNGLSQKNVEHEALYCYRQIDPAGFLEFLGLRFRRVEQCMTNDGHVFFFTPADCQIAVDKLRQATVNSKPAFYVEKDPVDDCKFFYQVAYWGVANADTKLCFADGLTVPFLSQFAIHAKRTGAHCIEGNYLAKGFELPPVVENSKIMTYLWPA